MDQHKDRAPSDPTTASDFAGDSSWTLSDGVGSGDYFFSGDRDRSILSEFGWNIEPERTNRIGADNGGGEGLWLPVQSALTGSLELVDTAARAAAAAASSSRSNNQCMSSSSSEDPAEKSTVSDEKPPPEIP